MSSTRQPSHHNPTPLGQEGRRDVRDGEGRPKRDNEPSSPVSSDSRPSSLPPLHCNQGGLSVVIPDYLSTQFVLDNLEHFKSSNHYRDAGEQGQCDANREATNARRQRRSSGQGDCVDHQHERQRQINDKRRSDSSTSVSRISNPPPQRPALQRTHSDIIPDNVPTQVVLQDLSRYRSSEHYHDNDRQDRRRTQQLQHSPESTSSSSRRVGEPFRPQTVKKDAFETLTRTVTAGTSGQDQVKEAQKAGFGPFRPLFAPPPVEAKSPSRKKRSPKGKTTKRSPIRPAAEIDDTDPIEDWSSDEDVRGEWKGGTEAKRRRLSPSPRGASPLASKGTGVSTTVGLGPTTPTKHPPKRVAQRVSSPSASSRPDSKARSGRSSLVPPAPLGPRLQQIAREEAQSKGPASATTSTDLVSVAPSLRPPASIGPKKPTTVVANEAMRAYLTELQKANQDTAQTKDHAAAPDSTTKPSVLSSPTTRSRLSSDSTRTGQVKATTSSRQTGASPSLKPIKQEPVDEAFPPEPPSPQEIPIPAQVVSFASRLTPIKDLSVRSHEAAYNVLALIQFVGPAQEVTSKAGRPLTMAKMVICDRDSIHLNVTLWGDRCRWTEFCNEGDVVLLTGLVAKEYQGKITASTGSLSRITRLDGPTLDRYRGDAMIERRLGDLSSMRRTLGRELLDREKGIARDPSFYKTFTASLLLPQGAGETDELSTDSRSGADGDDGKAQSKRVTKPREEAKVKIETADENKPSAVSAPVTGVSIRGLVAYRMLNEDGDESGGWEVGVMSVKRQFVRVRTTFTAPWIHELTPRKFMHFHGQWDVSTSTLIIDLSTREPNCLMEKGPDMDFSPVRISSVRKAIASQFMGIASVEGYIGCVNFPEEIMEGTSAWDSDTDGSMFAVACGICSNCSSRMVESDENPRTLICLDCQADPDKRAASVVKWSYPDFWFQLSDKPSPASKSSTETIRVMCQGVIGDQVFPTVPAANWAESIDKYHESVQEWTACMKELNGQPTRRAGQDMDIDEGGQDAELNTRRRRVRVELMIGKNRMVKPYRVKYLYLKAG
ncbi:hypothetical protein BGX29_008338 [Mortierella sp. GBA35]|nr:hypothetical protein BGX29_008338 [Mortierella sp. GBA35]